MTVAHDGTVYVSAHRLLGPDGSDPLKHTSLAGTHRELYSAYLFFTQLHPNLDQPTRAALSGRLCAFDVI